MKESRLRPELEQTMKRILLMLALCGFIGTPALAQEAGPEREKTPEELLKELHELMKEASKEMEAAEKELAKASLPPNKADVMAERMRVLREKLAKGEIDEIPEGLREYLRQHPEEAAKATGKTVEEFKKIVEDQEKLKELLKKQPDLLKKLAESEEAMEKVLKHEQEAERKLNEIVKKQEEAVEKSKDNVDKSIDVAHQLKQQGQGKGKPEMKDNEGKTKDPKDQGDKPKDGQGKNAESDYQPGEGKVERKDEKDDEFTRREGDGFKADPKKKDTAEGAGSEGAGGAPEKYKGFWDKWSKAVRERTKDAGKDTAKEVPKSGDKPK
jgi:hypothetical protein